MTEHARAATGRRTRRWLLIPPICSAVKVFDDGKIPAPTSPARIALADVARERAQAALDAERELRAQLDGQLKDSQKRLAAAEKARDAAIAALEQAARGRTPRRGPGAGGR